MCIFCRQAAPPGSQRRLICLGAFLPNAVHGAGWRLLYVLEGHPSLPFPHAGCEKSCGRSPLARYGALIIVSLGSLSLSGLSGPPWECRFAIGASQHGQPDEAAGITDAAAHLDRHLDFAADRLDTTVAPSTACRPWTAATPPSSATRFRRVGRWRVPRGS